MEESATEKAREEGEKEKEDTDDDEVEEEPTKKRSKNMQWTDSYEMIKIVKKEGKNWEKVLQELHKKHRCTHIKLSQAKEKLCPHYNNFTASKSPLGKPYHAPKFKLTKHEKKTLKTPTQKKDREAEFDLKATRGSQTVGQRN